jgi:hypothetical protein
LIANVFGLFQAAPQNCKSIDAKSGNFATRATFFVALLIGLPNEPLFHFFSHPEVRDISFWNRYERASLGIAASASVANLDGERSESA